MPEAARPVGASPACRALEKETFVTSQHAAYAAVFPISDQLPLGRATADLATMTLRSGNLLASDGVKTGHDPDERPAAALAVPEAPEAATEQPFGLRFATRPQGAVDLPLDAIAYDDDTQTALARDGAGWTPLIHHSMGLTLRTTGQIPREDEIHDKSS
ncbi:putative ATP-grasp-modified RiPP [Cryptosporangium aurantiacum]|uniref:Putative ATP-grasp target RiPP n=1 Tax=Cryptosporangium aurantiacum TaxID=134849 RepID=A0A1M7RE36_9ACTN|nr:putative ATP-grasp-modified RiPP [Cryptosporangium aurantiacum]SHN44583.1 putative ATP-grasp target RiPP [Cryptosporangium aurantiacum]